jgi:hypothetical protein
MKINGIIIYSNIVKLSGKNVEGWGWIFPLIILCKKYKKITHNSSQYNRKQQIINHERIHLTQVAECLFAFWYLIYFGHYIILRLKGLSHWEAYKNICFEKEAYMYDSNTEYLNNRKLFAWLRL